MRAGEQTLQLTFAGTARFEIPTFQRPYVWGEVGEWTPLWEDIREATDRLISDAASGNEPERPPRYFLGSVVVKGRSKRPQRLSTSTLVDGQQRLTTLQVLFAAARAVAEGVGASQAGALFDDWLVNPFKNVHPDHPDDRFKLWPLPQDRPAYLWAIRDVHDTSECPDAAHQVARCRMWFEGAIAEWAADEGTAAAVDRLLALHAALSDRMQIALITLEEEDDAQVIFESLNHRGVELSESDLIKNLLFRLADERNHHEAERLLVDHWLPLDGREWREIVVTGRIKRSKLDLLFAYWLTIQKSDVVSVERLFDEFKSWVTTRPSNVPETIRSARACADLFLTLTAGLGARPTRQLVDHIRSTNTTTVWPLLLWLHSKEAEIPPSQIAIACTALDSFLMRRGIVGLKASDYNRFFVTVLVNAQSVAHQISLAIPWSTRYSAATLRLESGQQTSIFFAGSSPPISTAQPRRPEFRPS